MDDNYVRDYTLLASSTLIVFVPTLCMLVSTLLISREMVRTTRGNTANGFLTNEQVKDST